MNGNEIDKSLSKMPRPLPEGQGAAGASFISKPARGWLHSDQQIAKEGITYAVRYVGCLEILTSMKSLDFETRSQVAKECINRVCEAAGLKTADKKRKVEKRVQRAIAEQPLMEHAGANVNLTISSCSLVLTALESGRVIAGHDMPRISFASGGDTDTLDFVAYVAKDLKDWRACYVLECGGGLAQDVITTIGQAFELRFKEFLTRPASITMCLNGADRDYYNDLPGKIPPELGPPPVPPLPNFHGTQPSMKSSATGSDTIPRDHSVVQQREPSERTVPREGVTSNLIDLNCEVAPPPPMPAPRREHDYVNDIVIGGNRDVFDMHERINCYEEEMAFLKKIREEYPESPPSSDIVEREIILKDMDERIKCYEEEMAFLKKMQEEYTESPPSSDIDERENVMKDMGWVRNLLEEMEDLRPELSVPFHSSIISKGVNEIDKLKGVRETDYEADGEPFSAAVPTEVLTPASQRAQLQKEVWFHGPVSRHEAEMLLTRDGDFLVRESQGSPGQYVLTGMQGGIKKHLLLVDPEGVVRTKDRMFESVSHLINYHCENELPIISAESALVLRRPVHKGRQT